MSKLRNLALAGLSLAVSFMAWPQFIHQTQLLRVPFANLVLVEGTVADRGGFEPPDESRWSRMVMGDLGGQRLRLDGQERLIDILRAQKVDIARIAAAQEPVSFWYRERECKTVDAGFGRGGTACRVAQIAVGSEMVYRFEENERRLRRSRSLSLAFGAVPILVLGAWLLLFLRREGYWGGGT